MLLLTRMLILSGLGVLVTHTSHCGSMGEHSISHFIDTFASPHPKTLHGGQVGIATWSMARLQAAMLASPEPPVLAPLPLDRRASSGDYGRLAPSCLDAVRRKPFDARRNRAAQSASVGAVARHARPPARRSCCRVAEIERVMRAAGAPLTAAELGVDPALYRRAVGEAHELRDRYGFLDLAAQAGTLAGFAAGEG